MKQGQLYANLVVLAAGILLIIFNDQNLVSTLIVILGVVLMLPCVASLISLLVRRAKDSKEGIKTNKALFASGVISSLCGVALGAWMIVSPGSLVGIMVYLFAVLLIVAGIYQIIMLSVGHRPIKFPVWMYIMPTLMTAAGIVILATDVKTIESVVVLITGISLVAFALNRIVEMVKIGNGQSQQQS